LFCAISSPILFIHVCSSSPVLSVSTSQLVWATYSLLLFSHVHILSILLSVEREFCRNIFFQLRDLSVPSITLSLLDFEIPVRPDGLPYCVCNSEASFAYAIMKIIITDTYVSEAAHLQGRLCDLTTPFLHPRNRRGVRTPSAVIAPHEGCMTYSPAQISFTECNSGTTQKLPFVVSTTNERKYTG
jgi:hypothetical protein